MCGAQEVGQQKKSIYWLHESSCFQTTQIQNNTKPILRIKMNPTGALSSFKINELEYVSVHCFAPKNDFVPKIATGSLPCRRTCASVGRNEQYGRWSGCSSHCLGKPRPPRNLQRVELVPRDRTPGEGTLLSSATTCWSGAAASCGPSWWRPPPPRLPSPASTSHVARSSGARGLKRRRRGKAWRSGETGRERSVAWIVAAAWWDGTSRSGEVSVERWWSGETGRTMSGRRLGGGQARRDGSGTRG